MNNKPTVYSCLKCGFWTTDENAEHEHGLKPSNTPPQPKPETQTVTATKDNELRFDPPLDLKAGRTYEMKITDVTEPKPETEPVKVTPDSFKDMKFNVEVNVEPAAPKNQDTPKCDCGFELDPSIDHESECSVWKGLYQDTQPIQITEEMVKRAVRASNEEQRRFMEKANDTQPEGIGVKEKFERFLEETYPKNLWGVVNWQPYIDWWLQEIAAAERRMAEKIIADIPVYVMETKTATALPLEKLKEQLTSKYLREDK